MTVGPEGVLTAVQKYSRIKERVNGKKAVTQLSRSPSQVFAF
jgi:hypothetical protein